MFFGLREKASRRLRKLLLSIVKPVIQEVVYNQTWIWGEHDKVKVSPTAHMVNTIFNTSSGIIEIGDYTFAGHNVSIITGTHDYRSLLAERQTNIPRQGHDIIIGKGVWIGSNATILGPCRIGDHAVIAAGAVVPPGMDVPSGAIVAGVPGRTLKCISTIESRQLIFEHIYRKHEWGGSSRSGPGSDPEHTVAYVQFVNKWLEARENIRHIVELGCGDWATSRLLHFGPTRIYLGTDIVSGVIESNRDRYGAANITFQCCDFLDEELPGGDLLLVKDVLQHLSNAGVIRFLTNVLPRYRYAIITNDAAKYEDRRLFRIWRTRRDLAMPNVDTSDGGSRPLVLEASPFNLAVAERFHYPVVLQKAPRRIVYEKEVLVWKNSNT